MNARIHRALDAEAPRPDRARMTSAFRFLPAVLPTAALVVLFGSNGCAPTVSESPTRAPAIEAPREQPIATADGLRIDLSDIQPALLERAGAEIVRERALDRAIAREAARRDIEVDEATIARERDLLTETLSSDPDRAERLLADLRVVRGLGPVRFAALLRRTALLRALVKGDVEIAEEVVIGAWDAVHGASRVTRIIAVSDLRDASRIRGALTDGADFAVLAVENSVDASGPRGGRLGPVSRFDPAWPRAFREAVFEARPGEVSAPVPVEGRILLIEVLEERPPSGVTLEEDRPRAERAASLAGERLLMDRLARRLVPPDAIEPISPALRWSLDPGR